MCTCLGVLETSLPALRNHPTSDTHCSLKFAHISLLRTSFWVQRVTQTMRPMFPKLKPQLGNRGLGFFKAARRPAQLAAAAARPVSPGYRIPSFSFRSCFSNHRSEHVRRTSHSRWTAPPIRVSPPPMR